MKPKQPATMQNPLLSLVVGLFLSLGAILSPTIELAEAETSTAVLDPVVADVIEMLKGGVAEPVILQWLESTGRRPVDIGSRELIALTAAGASEEMMTTLVELSEMSDGVAARVEDAPTAPVAGDAAAEIQPGPPARGGVEEGMADAVFQLTAKRVWTDEDEPDRPRERPWDVYLYLDGELVAWTSPTLEGEPVEARRVIAPGRRELRLVLQRYEELRSGWLYESLAVPTLVAFDVRPGIPIEIAIEMKRIWGLWRQRRDGGPLAFVIRQGDQVLAASQGTGGNPDRWNPVCEDVEANFPDAEKVPARFRDPMSRCIEWGDLWTGAGQSTSRRVILAELAEYGFQVPVR